LKWIELDSKFAKSLLSKIKKKPGKKTLPGPYLNEPHLKIFCNWYKVCPYGRMKGHGPCNKIIKDWLEKSGVFAIPTFFSCSNCDTVADLLFITTQGHIHRLICKELI